MTTLENTNENEQHPKAEKYVTNVKDTMRKIDSAPSVHSPGDEKECKSKQVPVDLIEEESMESFPASDPPGHLRSHTSDKPEPHRPNPDEV